MNEIQKILEKNKDFVNETLKKDPDYFKNLSKGQKPSILYIGCSDSRMPINAFTKTGPGEIFIHRNIGNQIFLNDMNAMSVIDYSVNNLQVKYIIVAGHYQCGAIKAIFNNNNSPLIDNWISNIKEIYLLNKKEIDNITDFDKKADYLSELNVIYQMKNLLKSSIIQNRFKSKPYPLFFSWIIDIYTGYIKNIELPLKEWVQINLIPKDYIC